MAIILTATVSHADETLQPNPISPSAIAGIEAEELTPDTFSGAYYRSILDRTLMVNHRVECFLVKRRPNQSLYNRSSKNYGRNLTGQP